MKEGKHWRELEEGKYLGSWEFEAKEVKTFTIKEVALEPVTGSNGRTDNLTVAHFTDGKPMILNKTNKKAIEACLKTGLINKWAGQQISMEVKKVKFGSGMVDGIRVLIAPKKATDTPPVVDTLPNLKKGSNEWNSIVGYLVDVNNASIDFETLFMNVAKKYKVTAILKKQLKKEHDEA